MHSSYQNRPTMGKLKVHSLAVHDLSFSGQKSIAPSYVTNESYSQQLRNSFTPPPLNTQSPSA